MRPTHLRWILWGSMLAALGPYAALPLVLPARGAPAPPPLDPRPLEVGFVLAALVAAGAALAVRRIAVRRPIERGVLDPERPVGAARMLALLALAWALAESIALLGLVLFFLAGDPRLAWAFVAASGALFLLLAPRLPERPHSAAELTRPDVRIG